MFSLKAAQQHTCCASRHLLKFTHSVVCCSFNDNSRRTVSPRKIHTRSNKMLFHFLQPAKNLSFYVLMLHHFHIIFLESMFVHRIHQHTSLSGWLFFFFLSRTVFISSLLCVMLFFSPTLTLAALPTLFTIHLSFDRRRFPPSSENTLFIFLLFFHSSLRRSVPLLTPSRFSLFGAVLCVAFFFRLCFIFLHSLALLSALSVLRFSQKSHWILYKKKKFLRKVIPSD